MDPLQLVWLWVVEEASVSSRPTKLTLVGICDVLCEVATLGGEVEWGAEPCPGGSGLTERVAFLNGTLMTFKLGDRSTDAGNEDAGVDMGSRVGRVLDFVSMPGRAIPPVPKTGWGAVIEVRCSN
jgi:hypothetical protein